MTQVGQIKIDFDIFSHTPQNLIIGDVSDWIYAENLPSYILITLPGSRKTINFSFKKKSLNVFNSHNLGISCLSGDCKEEVYVDLPDGIYTVCVKSSFDNIENSKFYLKTDRFEIEYAKVAIKYGVEYSKSNADFQDMMIDIQWLLTVAKSHAKLGDFLKAKRFFEEAKALLNKYTDCKDCI